MRQASTLTQSSTAMRLLGGHPRLRSGLQGEPERGNDPDQGKADQELTNRETLVRAGGAVHTDSNGRNINHLPSTEAVW